LPSNPYLEDTMRILLVDDHTLFRDALSEVLGPLSEDLTLFDAGNAEEARAAAAHYSALDLVLLDLYLPGNRDCSLLRDLCEALVSVPIVVVSASERPEDVRACLGAGAAGYIPKTLSSQHMISALRQVLAGEIFVPASLLAAMQSPGPGAPHTGIEVASDSETLSRRQLEVLALLAEGLPNKIIARRLDLTEGTVKLHVSAILRALAASNRTAAVMAAERRGLLRATDPGQAQG
jgi:DNA-binding NarL/FixJ family response regulator